MASFETYFSLVAFFIFLRETLEASVIIAVLLQCMNRTYPRLKRQVWGGAATGIGLSLVFGAIFAGVYYVAQTMLFAGSAKAIFQGCISYVACILITWLGFAMLRFSNIEKKFERKLDAAGAKAAARAGAALAGADAARGEASATASGKAGASAISLAPPAIAGDGESSAWTRAPDQQRVEAVNASDADAAAADATNAAPRASLAARVRAALCCTPADPDAPRAPLAARVRAALCCCCPGAAADDDFDPSNPLSTRAHAMSVFVLAMTAVLREGIESVIFLAGVGSNVPPTSIPLACLAGLIVGLAVGAFIFYGGRSIRDLRVFFCISTFMLFLIAAGQVALGTLLLSSAGAFGKYSAWTDQLTWQYRPLSDWSACCSESLNAPNKLFPFLKAIFGYTERPTPIITIMYCGYWAAVLTALAYKYRNGSLFDADYKRHKTLHALGRQAAAHRRRLARLERRQQGLRAELGLPLEGGGNDAGAAPSLLPRSDVEGAGGGGPEAAAAATAAAVAAAATVAAAAAAGDKKALRLGQVQGQLLEARRASAEAEAALAAENDRLRLEDEQMAQRRAEAYAAATGGGAEGEKQEGADAAEAGLLEAASPAQQQQPASSSSSKWAKWSKRA